MKAMTVEHDQGGKVATAILSVLFLAVLGAPQAVLGQNDRAVPATFMRDVRVPGHGDQVLRPSALSFDALHNEILVADPGHGRVVIFSGGGAYKFDFPLGSAMSYPLDLVADPDGTILVLGSNSAGRVLQRYDFDGMLMADLPVPEQLDGQAVDLAHLACDDQGNLYGLDVGGQRILKLTPQGAGLLCSLAPQLTDNTVGIYGLGTLVWDHGEFLLPVATSGSVLRYGTNGAFLGTIGHGGSKPGTLAFPVAAVRSPDGIYLVLDKNRFCVVCYGPDGAYLGEFGGKGYSPGWFVNPSLLAVPGSQTVVVGQIFANRIQIVGLPSFIRLKVSLATTIPPTLEPEGQVGFARIPAGSPNPRRFLSASTCSFTGGTDFGAHPIDSVSFSEATS